MNVPAAPNGLILSLPTLAILDLDGKDATAILHNLTTNGIKTLQVEGDENPGIGVETFVTNVKGKCLGHVLAFRTSSGFRLIGAGPTAVSQNGTSQSQTIAAHADRYTIREDAVPTVMDDQYRAWLMVGVREPTPAPDLSRRSVTVDGVEVNSYVVPWVGPMDGLPARLLLVPTQAACSVEAILATFTEAGVIADPGRVVVIDGGASVASFHAMRVASGFPWYGIDMDDSHLPQEVGREPQTISFTKGCYLGQETVARLDALGQVQKMLVPWALDLPANAPPPPADTKLFCGGEKPVGRLTSVAPIDASWQESLPRSFTPLASENGVPAFALGYARRSHFEPGAIATGIIGETEFTATVVSLAAQQGV